MNALLSLIPWGKLIPSPKVLGTGFVALIGLAVGIWLYVAVTGYYELKTEIKAANFQNAELRAQFVEYGARVSVLNTKYQVADRNAREALRVLHGHDLEKLLQAKPQMVATRATAATARVLTELEDLTVAFAGRSTSSPPNDPEPPNMGRIERNAVRERERL